MNRTINFLVRAATNTAFRSVQVRRVAPEPTGAALVLANHGGGLGDILTVIAGCSRFPRFLARDIIWKFPVARSVMDSVGAIPVSRRQDHGASADNSGLFGAAWAALSDGDLLAIYPEGESIAEPRLAPLRTGAARILLGAWERGTDVWIEPMGLHYYDISVLRGRGFVHVGTPVRLSELVGELPSPATSENRAAVRALTELIAQRLSKVVAEYSDWRQRRDYESAATVYLTDKSAGQMPTTATSRSPPRRSVGHRRICRRTSSLHCGPTSRCWSCWACAKGRSHGWPWPGVDWRGVRPSCWSWLPRPHTDW